MSVIVNEFVCLFLAENANKVPISAAKMVIPSYVCWDTQSIINIAARGGMSTMQELKKNGWMR